MVIAKRGPASGFTDTHRHTLSVSELANSNGVPPTAVTVGEWRGYAYTVADISNFQIPVPADWDQNVGAGSAITCTIRWACDEVVGAGVVVEYRVAYETVDQNNQVINAGTAATADTGDIIIPTLASQMTQNTVSTILAANLAAGDTIGVSLSRITAVGVSPTAEPEIYAVWFDYTRYISVT